MFIVVSQQEQIPRTDPATYDPALSLTAFFETVADAWAYIDYNGSNAELMHQRLRVLEVDAAEVTR